MLNSTKQDGRPLTLGILGGGQLAKMIASDAYRMGLNVAVIENHSESPAGDMTKTDFSNGWSDKKELDEFIAACDMATLENEFIDPVVLEYIEESIKVYPSSKTMKLVQDKFIQKTTFGNAGIKVPAFKAIDNYDDLEAFANEFGYPFLLKSRKFGYDGYGNATITDAGDAFEAWEKFSRDSRRNELMAEQYVSFTKELAVMVARNENGETEVYPCVETIQKNHICHKVLAPAEITEETADIARGMALECVKAIDGVGVFGIEFFLTNNNDILVNEIAPRPHNSGHYTIEACYTSQFENCIRAVLNLPLGSSAMIIPAAVMVNLLGERSGSGVPTDIRPALLSKKASLHLYNKKKSRIGRKMGHVTALGANLKEALLRADETANGVAW